MADRNPGRQARAFAYYRGRSRIAAERGDTAAAARFAELAQVHEEALVAAGRCRRCGRALTAEGSRRLGIGPECLARVVAR